MEISNQLNSVVESIVTEIRTKVMQEVQASIADAVELAVKNYDFDAKISAMTDNKVKEKVDHYVIDTSAINAKIGEAGVAAIERLTQAVNEQAVNIIRDHVAKVDMSPMLESSLKDYFDKTTFPKASINADALRFDNVKISGDRIVGGIIEEFSSTGIDDRSTKCQLTITDTAVVIEQKIISAGLEVKGTIQADVVSVDELQGSALEQIVKKSYETVLGDIANKGIIAPKLAFNDKVLIDSEHLANTIVRSNLRRVGILEELQTKGDTLLTGTLYITNGKVGVNTLEPTYAFSVWDEEVELVLNKDSLNRAFIGSRRPFTVTLGAAGKENISLDIDGSVTINDLRLGALPLGTASSSPNWAGRSGEILFNDSPAIGRPIGWVCLGGTRWGNFGTIQQ